MRVQSFGAVFGFCAIASAFPSYFSKYPRGLNTTLPPTSDLWTEASCSDDAIRNAAAAPSLRWKAADAKGAWDAVTAAWKAGQKQPGDEDLPFSSYVSHYFKGPERWNCQDIGDIPCSTTIQCNEVEHPAGFLILNSFAAIHQIYQHKWQALDTAMQLMQAEVGDFSSLFAPQDSSVEATKMLLNMLSFTIGYGSAFQWNVVIKNAKLFANDNYRGFYKDVFNGLVGFSIASAKDTLPAAASALSTQNTVSSSLGVLYGSWKDAEADFLRNLFSGKTDDWTLGGLTSLLQDGMMNTVSTNLDLSEMSHAARKVFYGKMIPAAWKVAGEKQRPIIVMTENICGTDRSAFEENLASDIIPKVTVCYNGKRAYVLHAQYQRLMQLCSARECGKRIDGYFDASFKMLPGGSNDILKDGKYGGVTLEDIVASSYEGYVLNGNKNGYQLPEVSKVIDGKGTEGDLIFENGIRTPGYISLPVCTDWEKVVHNVHNTPESGEFWPCE